MAAMIFILPPHLERVSTSMLKTLASNLAQEMFSFVSSSCFGSMIGRFHLAEPGNFSNRSHRSVSDVLFS
jgi:hypothetical protein